MRKKLLAFALAATMVVGSTTVAFAAGPSVTPNGAEVETTVSSPVGAEVELDSVTLQEAAAIQENATVKGVAEGVELKVSVPAATEIKKANETIESFTKLTTDAGKKAKERLDGKTPVVVDLKLDKSGTSVQPDGTVQITLTLKDVAASNEELAAASFVTVYRVGDESTLVFLGSVKVTDGNFTFGTDHFSTYIFAAAKQEEAADPVKEETAADAADNSSATDATAGGNPQTGDSAPVIPMAATAAAAAVLVGAAVVYRKKNA